MNKNSGYLDIILLVEKIVQEEKYGLNIEICNNLDPRLKGAVALYIPSIHTIIIRESVYEAAANCNHRHRFTIAHELGHAILHKNSELSLARMNSNDIKAYENPEWQANEFAGNLLLPIHFAVDKTDEELVEEFGVSYEVAGIQRSKARNL